MTVEPLLTLAERVRLRQTLHARPLDKHAPTATRSMTSASAARRRTDHQEARETTEAMNRTCRATLKSIAGVR